MRIYVYHGRKGCDSRTLFFSPHYVMACAVRSWECNEVKIYASFFVWSPLSRCHLREIMCEFWPPPSVCCVLICLIYHVPQPYHVLYFCPGFTHSFVAYLLKKNEWTRNLARKPLAGTCVRFCMFYSLFDFFVEWFKCGKRRLIKTSLSNDSWFYFFLLKIK